MVQILPFILPPLIISLPQTLSAIDFANLGELRNKLPGFLQQRLSRNTGANTGDLEFNPELGVGGAPETGFVTVEELYARYITGAEELGQALWGGSGTGGGGIGEDVWFVWFTQKEAETEERDKEEDKGDVRNERSVVKDNVEKGEEEGEEEGEEKSEERSEEKGVEWDGDRVFNDSAISISQSFEAANPILPQQSVEDPDYIPAIRESKPRFVYINCHHPTALPLCRRFLIVPAHLPKLYVIADRNPTEGTHATIYPIPHLANLTIANFTSIWEEKHWQQQTPWTGALNPINGTLNCALNGKVGESFGKVHALWHLLPGWALSMLIGLTLQRVTVKVLDRSQKRREAKQAEKRERKAAAAEKKAIVPQSVVVEESNAAGPSTI